MPRLCEKISFLFVKHKLNLKILLSSSLWEIKGTFLEICLIVLFIVSRAFPLIRPYSENVLAVITIISLGTKAEFSSPTGPSISTMRITTRFFAALPVPAEWTGAFVWLIAYAAMHAGRVA